MKYTAMIVEPRVFDRFPKLIQHYHKTLGPDWHIIYYCGKGLSDYWKPILTPLAPTIEIRELPVENLNAETHNDWYKQQWLWESIPTEWVLTFQHDTWIINQSPYTIDTFIKRNKSFIGGNMYYQWAEHTREGIFPPWRSFNGGLSLRKRDDMIRICKAWPAKTTVKEPQCMEESAEDCYYSIGCYRLGLPTGDEEEDSHFSLHTIFHPQCFGLHQPTKEVKEQLLQFYPEAATAYI